MKKNLVLGLLLLVCACGALGAAENPKVLLLMQFKTNHLSFMIRNEVKPMIKLLNDAGYTVSVATESGRPVGYADAQIMPDLRFDQVELDTYSGIIIPCMAVMQTKDTIPSAAVELVRAAYESGLPLAAQNSGVTILGQAGILQGKKYASEENFVPLIPGGIYKGVGVVHDGEVVTSGTCPWLASEGKGQDGTAELTKTFISMLREKR